MHTQFWISEDVELVCSRGAFEYPLHTHVSMLTLNYVRSGQVIVYTRTGTRQYRTGECFGFVPYAAHRMTRSADSEVVSVCCAAQYTYGECLLNNERIACMLIEFQKQGLLSIQEVEGLKHSLLLLQPIFIDAICAGDVCTQHLFNFLKAHSEDHKSLALLTRQCGRSVWAAIRRFRDVTGMTPHQFQMQNRIRQAKRLLRENTSLTDVALSAGFCDQSHLNRCLMRAVGLTPARYRVACHNVVCRLAQGREKLGQKV